MLEALTEVLGGQGEVPDRTCCCSSLTRERPLVALTLEEMGLACGAACRAARSYTRCPSTRPCTSTCSLSACPQHVCVRHPLLQLLGLVGDISPKVGQNEGELSCVVAP